MPSPRLLAGLFAVLAACTLAPAARADDCGIAHDVLADCRLSVWPLPHDVGAVTTPACGTITWNLDDLFTPPAAGMPSVPPAGCRAWVGLGVATLDLGAPP